MAERKLYIGSVGPFLYDDDVAIDDPEGDFAGEDHCGVVTDGQLLVEAAPSSNHHVLRFGDIAFISNPGLFDLTGVRGLNTVFQNGNYLTMLQVVVRLNDAPVTTVAPTTAPATILTTIGPTTAPPFSGPRLQILTGAANPPLTLVASGSKDGALAGYIEMTLSTLIKPNYYFMALEETPYVHVIKWIEYRMGT